MPGRARLCWSLAQRVSPCAGSIRVTVTVKVNRIMTLWPCLEPPNCIFTPRNSLCCTHTQHATPRKIRDAHTAWSRVLAGLQSAKHRRWRADVRAGFCVHKSTLAGRVSPSSHAVDSRPRVHDHGSCFRLHVLDLREIARRCFRPWKRQSTFV